MVKHKALIITIAVVCATALWHIHEGKNELAVYSLLSMIGFLLIIVIYYLSQLLEVARKASSEIKFHLGSILMKLRDAYDENVKTEIVNQYDEIAEFINKIDDDE